MVPLYIQICALLVSTFGLSSVTAKTCEKTETSLVKLDLAKHSISIAKSLYPKCKDETNHSECSTKYKSIAYLNAALDLISEATMMCYSCPEPKVIVLQDTPMDCSDVKRNGFNKSGVYQVWPRGRGVNSNESIDVYCDMKTDGGGWTVNYSVRFDLVDKKREYRYATYDSFSVGDENSSYVLHINGHTGNATNDMKSHNQQKFSTKDRQNDSRGVTTSCATMYKSAFWFSKGCGNVNLNGVYQPGVKDDKNIWWMGWKGNYECLYSVEIKIRRKNDHITTEPAE